MSFRPCKCPKQYIFDLRARKYQCLQEQKVYFMTVGFVDLLRNQVLEIVGAPREGDCTWCEARRSGDEERAFLGKTCFLVMQGSDTLSGCSNVDQEGASTPRYHGKKNLVVSCPSHLLSSFSYILFLLRLLLDCFYLEIYHVSLFLLTSWHICQCDLS